ncbi:SDR family oxidoreductase [Carboxylicivirga mesophila]|uniref:SDR family oxidoreductase n=1 Tax=Carboxylicivirga mesophila TaxID=1166478 RepID=A0ABS5KGH6_9BACT|nr:SDR family oxidoreductase [Carboxylicivirga mesophila]MBS2213942.1 SDR family oxidoreductase [Carboxylicivirga mesophila]
MLSINLKDKVAIVTGVSSGIGAGIAEVLARAGCHIAGCARTNASDPKVMDFIMSVEKWQREAYYHPVDVTRKEDIEIFVNKVIKRFGRVDIVISNAGVNVFRGVDNCSDEDWDYNNKLNLSSHWHLGKICKPWLEKAENSVFQVITSNHAFASIPGCFPYNVTKTALTGLVRAMAIEWGPSIRVVGIAPGFIDTPGNDKWFNSFPDAQAERQRTIDMHPAGKLGTPEEVGSWCAFLASSFAAFATGTTYLIDGGRSALMQDA